MSYARGKPPVCVLAGAYLSSNAGDLNFKGKRKPTDDACLVVHLFDVVNAELQETELLHAFPILLTDRTRQRLPLTSAHVRLRHPQCCLPPPAICGQCMSVTSLPLGHTRAHPKPLLPGHCVPKHESHQALEAASCVPQSGSYVVTPISSR